MRVMDQLGLMDELMKESKAISGIRYFDRMEKGVSLQGSDAMTDMLFCETRYGNAIRTIPRSVLINLLLVRIPRHKILLGKRVIRTKETTITQTPKYGIEGATGHVTCFCDDGSHYQGSILVGADGTYSTVRKSMYQSIVQSGEATFDEIEKEQQERKGVPTVGERVMPHQHCIVGVTEPLDPLEFKAIGNEYVEFQVLRGKDTKHSIWLMPLTGYRIAWNVFFHFPEDLLQEYKHLQSIPSSSISNNEKRSNTDGYWQSISKRVHDRAQAALQDLRSVPNPLSNRNGQFGDLLDLTDPTRISKVTLEQGVFSRWFHGRVVLVGDAAHKSLPYAGQGANQAILDCIYLVSKIYLLAKPQIDNAATESVNSTRIASAFTRMTLRSHSQHTATSRYSRSSGAKAAVPPVQNWINPKNTELRQVFQEYYTQRSTIAQQATWGASWADMIFGGQGWAARIVRFVFFKLIPEQLFYRVSDPYFSLQPVLPFLPDVSLNRRGWKCAELVPPTLYW
ncbi:hypothetical protein FBU30_001118 [Linnemannia zychae]|nr:hypothetical protein FBU30_001118 [Linnemannia zychae]